MAHKEQRDFIDLVQHKWPDNFKNKRVLEVGSLDINGSIRDFFSDCEYIGLDIAPGKGVDIVCEGQDYDEPDESFDTACSAECFEHNPYWKETFENMIRMCKKGGLVFFTCATDGRQEHGTTATTPEDSPFTVNWNYYRNLNEGDFRRNFAIDDIFEKSMFFVGTTTHDLYFVGIKK